MLQALFFFLVLSPQIIFAQPQIIDDSKIRFTTRKQALTVRKNVIKAIWGQNTLPRSIQPIQIKSDVLHALSASQTVSKVDQWTVRIGPKEIAGRSQILIFYPQVRSNHELVIYHQGHSHTLEENGGLDTIRFFTERGYTVAGILMPSYGTSTSPTGHGYYHGDLFRSEITDKISPFRYFLDPVLATINYAQNTGLYARFHMTGVSGGGWTTTVYSALDPRIRYSFPVAGTLPLSMRQLRDIGDLEQYQSAFYTIAGYPELYVLSAIDQGRASIQILNPLDSCCFAISTQPNYVRDVQKTLQSIKSAGIFSLHLVTPFAGHAINREALDRMLSVIENRP